MTSSVMSLLAPRGRSFTSSTTPLVFISEWRSYLGRPPASCEGFCAGAMVTHNIKNQANRNGVLVAGERRMGFFRLSSTGPPSGRPRARYGGRSAFRRARPEETETQKQWAAVLGFAKKASLRYKAVYWFVHSEDNRMVHPVGF